MTDHDLRELLGRLGLSQVACARLVGVDARAVRRWVAPGGVVPEPAARFLRLMEVQKLKPGRVAALLDLEL
jgi:DNA-binding transcriptional regulator YiaG